jgi:FkbM family methyltransferase
MYIAPLISRYWPFANGSGRILDRYARRINLGSGERVAMTSDGFPLQVYADDLIGRHILLSGKFDRSIVQVLLDHARPGDMLLDIGANIGYVSAVFLQNVVCSKATCIEPQPGVVDLLRKNMAQFGGRAEIVQIGLADRDARLRFHVNQANRGASRISEDGEIEIPVREAGKVLSALRKVDLIKIDVEGFEGPIFRAIEGQLLRLKPRAILFEDQMGAASPDGIIGSILTRVGYIIHGIEKSLLATRLLRIQSREDCRFNDYLALAR